jgi:MFS transporter, DHA2 family, multidrug resistance protein
MTAQPLPPGPRRTMVTVCAMTATIMQALDTTVANVAMPYMQGSLSASLDQVNWVLTSYIVASAIMTAPVGWLASRFGRKKLFIICAAGFTFASVLCGLAQDIGQMVVYRLLQGAFGAALVPLSQSVMLDAYALHERARAMSIWGMGVMLGPIMGPTLGAWLTETYSWHWVFLINLPFGIVTVIGLLIFMDETEGNAAMKFDWFGFIALAIGIGSIQMMLDRGEQLGWFGSTEIVFWAIAGAVGFYYFLAHSLTTATPFVRFEVFKDKNFLSGCIFMVVMGVTLFGTLALMSPFLQSVLGYPIMDAGMLMATRGLGTFVAMMSVGRIMRHFEARTLILAGLVVMAATLWGTSYFTNDTSYLTLVLYSIVQGFSFGLIFVPMNTVAFMTLPQHLRTDGTSILTLARNIASSIGISILIAELTRNTASTHAVLSESINPFRAALQMPNVASALDLATDAGRAMADRMVNLQAQIIAYSDDFRLLVVLAVLSLPLVLLIGSTKAALRAQRKPPPAEVME